MRGILGFLGLCGVLFVMQTALAQPQPPQVEWTRTVTPPPEFMHDGWDCAAAGDGGVLIALLRGIDHSPQDSTGELWLCRLDAAGDTLWTRTRGVGRVAGHEVWSVSAASLYHNVWMISTVAGLVHAVNDAGDSLWTQDRCVSEGSWEGLVCRSIQRLADGSVVLAGGAVDFNSQIGRGTVLVKLDTSGVVQWYRNFNCGYGDPWISYFKTVAELPSGELLAVGQRVSSRRFARVGAATGDSLWLQERTGGSRVEDAATVDGDGWLEVAASVRRVNLQRDTLWQREWRATALERVSLTDYLALQGFPADSQHERAFAFTNLGDSLGSVDLPLPPGVCRTRLLAATDRRSIAGTRLPTGEIWLAKVWLPDPAISAASDAPLPDALALTAYPNPFNPATTLAFTLPRAAEASLRIYDVNGRLVATLADGVLAAGTHTRTIDGADLPSGLYFARLQAGTISHTQKLLLVK